MKSKGCFYMVNKVIYSIEHTIYGIIRNIVGQKLTKHSINVKLTGFVIMAVLLCIMYGMTFNGCSTIMFIFSGLINLFAIFFLKEQGIRIGAACAAICNICAFVLVGSYASILGETLCGVMGITSFIKYYHCERSMQE